LKKLENNELTEDEKMEIIADYLESSGDVPEDVTLFIENAPFEDEGTFDIDKDVFESVWEIVQYSLNMKRQDGQVMVKGRVPCIMAAGSYVYSESGESLGGVLMRAVFYENEVIVSGSDNKRSIRLYFASAYNDNETLGLTAHVTLAEKRDGTYTGTYSTKKINLQ